LKICQLTEKDVKQISTLWSYTKNFGENFIANLIKYNLNVGLSDGEKLIGWCLMYDVGALAALQVKEKYLRRGYGTLLVKAISKKFSQSFNCDVLANTSYDNNQSISLLTNLGFIEIDSNSWIDVMRKE
jgi:N-acetylglutamate synthase-like GNAT family acetyltransferase